MQYDLQPSHKFTFGLWTVGNSGRDPVVGPVCVRGLSYERLDQLIVELLLGVR